MKLRIGGRALSGAQHTWVVLKKFEGEENVERHLCKVGEVFDFDNVVNAADYVKRGLATKVNGDPPAAKNKGGR